MQNARKTILFIFLLTAYLSRSQDTGVIRNYINAYKELAIAEMQRTGVPAAIKLAQGIHETLAGTSDLVLKSNNHFGIKCKDSWTGASVYHDDDLRGECFRKYASAELSYRDHSDFLRSSPRYSFLFDLDPTDYQAWARGLKKAGYATNPRYADVIIRLVEDYHLEDYTMIAMGKLPSKEEPVVTVMKPETPPAKTVLQSADTKVQDQSIPVNSPEPKPAVAIVKTEEPIKTNTKEAGPQAVQQPIYPEGEFKLNETRVMYARQGISFLVIAEQYNIPLARIFEFNDMAETETVGKDQLIFLQRKRRTGNNEFHMVQRGETLHDIAQLEAIRLETLVEYNFLQGNAKPAIGEQLWLRTKATTMPKLALKEDYTLYASPVKQVLMNTTSAATNNPVTVVAEKQVSKQLIRYIVKLHETIYAVSKKYDVPIEDIVKWNRLDGQNLKTGQTLKIYK